MNYSLVSILIRGFCYMLLSGILVTVVYSRLFGHGEFCRSVMGDGYQRVIKNIAEEGTDLAGYGLFLIAALELLYVSAWRAEKSYPCVQ